VIFKQQFLAIIAVAAALCAAAQAPADAVQWFNHTMEDEWYDAVGKVTTIDFTGHVNGELISDQYAHLGVNFFSFGVVYFFNSCIFNNDCWGMVGEGGGGAWVYFDEPMNWIAAEFPGTLRYALYYDDDLIYESFSFGAAPTGNFAGLVSEKPFNKVLLFRDFSNLVAIDDLHFGALVVPVPGALALFGLAVVGKRRRRLP
jgi:hypothetical protein